MKRSVAIFLFCLISSAIASTMYVSAQERQSVTEKSCLQAKEILERGIQAAGGPQALQSVANISRTFEGRRYDIKQGLRPEPPYTHRPITLKAILDYQAGRGVAETQYSIIGGLKQHTRQIIKDANNGFGVNLETKRYTPTPGGPLNVNRFPEGLLKNALAQITNLRWLGDEIYEGKKLQGISFPVQNGAQISLFFDAQTGLLMKSESIANIVTLGYAGDTTLEYIFSDYREINGIKIPYKTDTKYGGEVWEEMKLTEVKINAALSPALFEPPTEGFERNTPASPAPTVSKLAEDVYFVRANYNSLFINFADYVLVIEGPVSDTRTQQVNNLIKQTIPNKPIKYVVTTHFHADHVGGLREYIAQGVTIITTPMTKGVIEKMAAAPRKIRPDSLAKAPRPPIIETFTDKRTLTDGAHTVELYNIGPNPHVAEMVIIYLPKEKILYVADVLDIQIGETPPASEDIVDFGDKLLKLGLEVETIIPAHGRQGTIEDLKKTLELKGISLRRSGQ